MSQNIRIVVKPPEVSEPTSISLKIVEFGNPASPEVHSAIDDGEVAIKRYEDTPEEWVFNSDNTSYLPRKVLKINVPSHPILGIVVYNLTQNCPVR